MTDRAQLDVLAFGAHPDDVELSAGGTVCVLVDKGYRVGIVDLTRGELGSRGSADLREKEAAASSKILGVVNRDNLRIPDGNIENSPENRLKVIRSLRQWRPNMLLITAPECRHPDHGNATRLITESVFYSGLVKLEVEDSDGNSLAPWRPAHVLHFMQAIEFEPTLVVDVTDVWERRIKALKAFESQFHNPAYDAENDEPETFISNPGFMKLVEARAIAYGYRVGAAFGEPFLYRHGPIGTNDPIAMLQKDTPYR